MSCRVREPTESDGGKLALVLDDGPESTNPFPGVFRGRRQERVADLVKKFRAETQEIEILEERFDRGNGTVCRRKKFRQFSRQRSAVGTHFRCSAELPNGFPLVSPDTDGESPEEQLDGLGAGSIRQGGGPER